MVPLIYAIIVYRRLLGYDDYHLPGNHKAYGFTAVEEGAEERRSSAHLSPPTPYDPTGLTLGTTTTVTGGEPRTRDRSVSFGSRRISLNFTRPAGVSPQPSPPLPLPLDERRVSYDHKRDTQFEAYTARRASQHTSRHNSSGSGSGSGSYHNNDDVSRALGDEFGFSDLPSPSPAEPGRVVVGAGGRGGGGGEIVSAGAVHAAHAPRPRVSSIGMARQTSYEAVLSAAGPASAGPKFAVTVTTPPGEGPRRGRSLNLGYIPEEEDHHHHHHQHHYQYQNQHHYGEGQGEDQDQDQGRENFIAAGNAGANEKANATGRVGRRRAVSESQQALLGAGQDGDASAMERGEGLEDVELGGMGRR